MDLHPPRVAVMGLSWLWLASLVQGFLGQHQGLQQATHWSSLRLGRVSTEPRTRGEGRLLLTRSVAIVPSRRLAAVGGADDEEAEDEFKGKQRRALRALAGRKKADKSLYTVQQADTEPSEVWVKELSSALKAHELVNIRAQCAPTKKETKRIGEIVSAKTGAELVQVIGHTYLLYKPSDSPKIDLAALTAAAAAPSPPKKKE